MIKIADIKEWWFFIRKHPVIGAIIVICIIIAMLTVIPYMMSYFAEKGRSNALLTSELKPQPHENANIHDVAFAIYTETLGIVKKLKICIAKVEKSKKMNLEGMKFSQKVICDFDKRQLLPEYDLKNQLTNFCNAINSLDSSYQKQDLQRCIDQGEDVLSKFNKYYTFKDYDGDKQLTNFSVVSPDVSVQPRVAASASTVAFPGKNEK